MCFGIALPLALWKNRSHNIAYNLLILTVWRWTRTLLPASHLAQTQQHDDFAQQSAIPVCVCVCVCGGGGGGGGGEGEKGEGRFTTALHFY